MLTKFSFLRAFPLVQALFSLLFVLLDKFDVFKRSGVKRQIFTLVLLTKSYGYTVVVVHGFVS